MDKIYKIEGMKTHGEWTYPSTIIECRFSNIQLKRNNRYQQGEWYLQTNRIGIIIAVAIYKALVRVKWEDTNTICSLHLSQISIINEVEKQYELVDE